MGSACFQDDGLVLSLLYCGIAVAAYLIGAIPSGLLIGKFYHVDIRKVGSGNIGATNVTRAIGKGAGRLCFFCDFLKGAVPVFLVNVLTGSAFAAILAGLMTIIGHMFPVYLKFKGGKGISTTAGVGLALAPLPLLGAAATWAAVFFASRYVSLASIAASIALPTFVILFGVFGIGGAVACSPLTMGFFVLIGVLAVWKHSSNIKRLLDGTEHRFERKK